MSLAIRIWFMVMLALALSMPAHAAEPWWVGVAASGGAFTPGPDYASGWDGATDVAISVLAMEDNAGGTPFGVGLEGCLHMYSTELAGAVPSEVTSAGIEGIAFVYLSGWLQPFLGVGLGSYANTLTVLGVEDDGEGMGALVKAGLRVFPAEGFFVGGYFKAFTNEQGIRQPSGDTVYVDFGGTVAAFEAGLAW